MISKPFVQGFATRIPSATGIQIQPSPIRTKSLKNARSHGDSRIPAMTCERYKSSLRNRSIILELRSADWQLRLPLGLTIDCVYRQGASFESVLVKSL